MERRVTKVGPELEFWTELPQDTDIRLDTKGRLMLDVGVNQGEAIGEPPQPSVGAAFRHLRDVLALVADEAEFAPFRPEGLPGRHQWLTDSKPRVAAMYEALRRERPTRFHHVKNMTEAAAAHLGVSGHFNPMGPDGLFVRNVFENIGPFYAAQVHREERCGKGHLAIWRGYADGRRFPQWNRWLVTRAEFIRHFESTPRLVGKCGSSFVPLPGGRQKLHNRLDHGFSWWLARPKPLLYRQWYLELRFLPSMEVGRFEYHAGLIVEAVEILLDWFHRENAGRPVREWQDATPAIALLHEFNRRYFPTGAQTERQWLRDFAR